MYHTLPLKNEKKEIDNKLLTDFNTKSKEVKTGLEKALTGLPQPQTKTITQLSKKIKKIFFRPFLGALNLSVRPICYRNI